MFRLFSNVWKWKKWTVSDPKHPNTKKVDRIGRITVWIDRIGYFWIPLIGSTPFILISLFQYSFWAIFRTYFITKNDHKRPQLYYHIIFYGLIFLDFHELHPTKHLQKWWKFNRKNKKEGESNKQSSIRHWDF